MRYLMLVLFLSGCSAKPVIKNERGIVKQKLSCSDSECSFIVEFGESEYVMNGHVRTVVPQVVWRNCVDGECEERFRW